MVSRMTLILYILQAKNIFWLYEQPSSSILWCHPRMEEFIKRHPAWRCFTWMGGFGADSPKGTTLWSSRPAVRKLARSLPQNRQWTAEMTQKKLSMMVGFLFVVERFETKSNIHHGIWLKYFECMVGRQRPC